MERDLDISRWPRRQLFEFYRDFELPFFNICAEVDVTDAVRICKERGLSFFLATLYLSVRACNDIEEFRLRIRGDRVVVHDAVHPGSTVLNEDETFGFCYFTYQRDFLDFYPAAQQTLEAYRRQSRELRPEKERDDLIYYSILPWISFRSFSHARSLRRRESIPRLVFGKHFEQDGARKMPVSVEVHHALADGLHVGRFLDAFQTGLHGAAETLGSPGNGRA